MSNATVDLPASSGGGSGTVTSVAISAPNIFTVSGSPVTSSGTLALGLATQVKNTFWAGPGTGSDATPAFRAMVLADLPFTGTPSSSNFARGDGTWGAPASAAFSIVTKSAAYTLAATETYAKVSAASAWTLSLPASPVTGQVYRVHKSDNNFNAITVSDGGSFSTTVNTIDEKVDCIYDGSAWFVGGRMIPEEEFSYTPNDGSSHQIGAQTTAPGLGSGFTLAAYWSRRGRCMKVRWEFSQTAAGSSGSGNYSFPLPTGPTINSSLVNTAPAGANQCLGAADFLSSNAGTSAQTGFVQVFSSTALQLWFTATGVIGSGAGVMFNSTTLRFGFSAEVPISGWNG